jgi:hypothetical protein
VITRLHGKRSWYAEGAGPYFPEACGVFISFQAFQACVSGVKEIMQAFAAHMKQTREAAQN